MNGQTSSTNWGCIAGVAVVVAVICSLLAIPMAVSAVTTDPHEWVREHYTHVSGDDPDEGPVVYSSSDDVDSVLAAVVAGTRPDERQRGSATTTSLSSPTGADPQDVHYLRYDDDWLICVYPSDGQTQIEVTEFDEGYRRHAGHVGHWYRHRGSSFRGGGGGYGK
ncbi:DUF4247 domain-containing protein [Janibacter anophelis]|uniref:DUF4247 domain-containing protein n=1 Tax=Janibacter anophelis TaxID=319054 RepID=UPI003F7EF5B7